MTTTWVNDKSYYGTHAYITSKVNNIKSIMWREGGSPRSSWSTNQFNTDAASNIGEIIVPANTVLTEGSRNLIFVTAITRVSNYYPKGYVKLELGLSYEGYYKYGSGPYTGLAFVIKMVDAIGKISVLSAKSLVEDEINTWIGSEVMLTNEQKALSLSGTGLIDGVPDLTITE